MLCAPGVESRYTNSQHHYFTAILQPTRCVPLMLCTCARGARQTVTQGPRIVPPPREGGGLFRHPPTHPPTQNFQDTHPPSPPPIPVGRPRSTSLVWLVEPLVASGLASLLGQRLRIPWFPDHEVWSALSQHRSHHRCGMLWHMRGFWARCSTSVVCCCSRHFASGVAIGARTQCHRSGGS